MVTESLAQKTASAFRMECRVAVHVAAAPERVWALLTDLAALPRWNSTVTSIAGKVTLGAKLAIRVPGSDRTFTPRVAELEPGRRMVWRDGMAALFRGERIFTVTPRADGTTDFEMVETFTGVMLPMVKGSLPDFAPVFDRYARDLQAEAERRPS